MRDQHIRLVEGGGGWGAQLVSLMQLQPVKKTPAGQENSSRSRKLHASRYHFLTLGVEQDTIDSTMATAIAMLLSTTWTNPCGVDPAPVWTGWATPTIGPAAPTLFWADYQPSSCYPPAFSAMSWGNATYSRLEGVSFWLYLYVHATSTSNSQNQETDAVCCQS